MPIPDELPKTDEAGNPSGLRWTWRPGLWAFILILVLTIGVVLFDPPLPPLDDPQAGSAREIAEKDNGWLFLAKNGVTGICRTLPDRRRTIRPYSSKPKPLGTETIPCWRRPPCGGGTD